jgi:signal peptidase I
VIVVECTKHQTRKWHLVEWRGLLDFLKSIALAVLAAMLIRGFLLQAFYIP